METKHSLQMVAHEEHHRLLSSRTVASAAAAGAIAIFGLHAEAPGAEAASVQPGALAKQAGELIIATTTAWAQHELPDGRFVNPVIGGRPNPVPKTGQAMIEAGVVLGNQDLVSKGIKASVAATYYPNTDGFNVGLEMTSLAGGYAWNEQNLTENTEWQAARDRISRYMRVHNTQGVNSRSADLAKCFDDPHCYYNLKLVKATADTYLKEIGMPPMNLKTSKGKPAPHLKTNAIINQAISNTSSTGYRVGDKVSYRDAGILSDPDRNPLAYHSLSSMLLGRILEARGYNNSPMALRKAFKRTTKGLVGLMSPNGDISYIGRGQGQVWTVAAAADAMSIAAKNETNPVWRGRYLEGAERAIDRLQTLYKPGKWGFPLTPRSVGVDEQVSDKGIDSYGGPSGYNGTTLWALADAIGNLQQTKPAVKQAIASDTNGVFVDPTQTKFASVKHGNHWYAIHGSSTHPDARYDFGVVAGQRKMPSGVWKDTLTRRPLTEEKTSGGPVIIDSGRMMVPVGRRISARSNGKVTVKGGWGFPNGRPLIDSGTTWTFNPEKNGVSMNFRAKRPHSYQFKVWYDRGSKIKQFKRGIVVTDPTGTKQRYSFNKPIEIRNNRTIMAHSAYNANLRSATMTVKAQTGSKIKYTIGF